jgi:DNA polymerase/3'-5' exonuclease PolX
MTATLTPISKQKFPATSALEVAQAIITELAPACERIEIAGSLRRRKSFVGDIEILYVPKTTPLYDLLGETMHDVPLPDIVIARLVGAERILEKRKNIKGAEAFGDHIKLMRHIASGIPVDLFACAPESWFNYLVCRTGGAQSNTRIAGLAKSRGYKWKPYSPGFVDLNDPDETPIPMESEEAVFRFVGLKFEQPWERP